MDIRSFALGVALLGTPAGAAGAQGVNPACQDPAFVGVAMQGGDACQQAMDTFAYASQQYAVALAAGNPEIGRADALGAFPRFRAALHVTLMNLAVPAFRSNGISPRPAVSSRIATQATDFASIAADGVLGLFRGIEVGGVQAGALDAYLNVNIAPATSAAGFDASPSQKIYLGFGARLGVMREGKIIPGVGLSYLQRNLPPIDVLASDVFQNSVSVSRLHLDTHAWSVTVGKHFGAASLVLGAGRTTFNSTGAVSWSSSGQSPPTRPTVSAASTQSQFFGDFGIHLGPMELVFELGQVSGSQVHTYNSFDPPADGTRSFASVAPTVER